MPGLWQPQASRRVAVVRLAPLYRIRFGYRGGGLPAWAASGSSYGVLTEPSSRTFEP
jgi:hypothetical protein